MTERAYEAAQRKGFNRPAALRSNRRKLSPPRRRAHKSWLNCTAALPQVSAMGILTSLRGAANGCKDGEAIAKPRSTTVQSGERHPGDGTDRSRPAGREERSEKWAGSCPKMPVNRGSRREALLG